jgi:hypothetical protein
LVLPLQRHCNFGAFVGVCVRRITGKTRKVVDLRESGSNLQLALKRLPRRSACLPFDAGPREHAYNQKQSRQTAGHKWRRSDAPHFEDARTSSFVELREHGCPPIVARLRGLVNTLGGLAL